MKVFIQKFRKIMSISLDKLRKRTPPPDADEKRVKKTSGRFDGLSEEDVKKNTLTDLLRPDLDLVFLGINPSLMAAHTGRYYAGPGNHFYKLLYESQLIPKPISYENDEKLLEYNIGLTNIVARATRSSADLSRSELKKGAMIVHEKLKKYKPKIAVFNGKCIYEEFADKYDKKSFKFGLQPRKVGDTVLWVVPSSSARCANFPRMQDKLHFYTSLKTYLSFLKGEIDEVNPEEFRFEGRCKQAVPSTSKMWRRKGLSAFANGGRIVNKETFCMDTSEENILAIPRTNEFIVKNIKTKQSDSEKDSGISESQTDNSQELSQSKEADIGENSGNQQNNSESSRSDSPPSYEAEVHGNNLSQKNNSPSKRRQQNKKTSEKKALKRASVNIPSRDQSNTIDFMNLIKQRLSNKELENDSKEKECERDESSLPPKSSGKGLQFANLSSKRLKRGFKVQKLDVADLDD